jgi:hypothetical protein
MSPDGTRWYTVLLLSEEGRQLVSTRLPWGTPLMNVQEPESLRQLVARGEPVVGVTVHPPKKSEKEDRQGPSIHDLPCAWTPRYA